MTDYLDRFWSNYEDIYYIFTMNWFICLEERFQYSHESWQMIIAERLNMKNMQIDEDVTEMFTMQLVCLCFKMKHDKR